MKTIHTLLFLLFLTITYSISLAQELSQESKKEIDSFRLQLNRSQSDTVEVRLRYQIGEKSWLMRTGFWDSIIYDAHKFNVPKIESRAYIKLAYVLIMHNKGEDPLEYLNKAYDIAEKNDDKSTVLSALNAIANYHYLTLSNNKKALFYCYKAIKIAEESNNKKKLADFYLLIGEIYFQSGDSKKAIESQRKCLILYEECDDHLGISQVLTRLGEMHKAINDTSKAIYYFLRSGKYLEELGYSIPAVQVNLSLGEVNELRGKFSEAAIYYEKALLISRKKSAIMEPLVLNNLSNVNFKRGNLILAERQALEALELINAAGIKHQVNVLAELLKEIYLKKHDYKKAFEYFKLEVNIRDSLVNEKNNKQALQKEFSYNLEKKENQNKLLSQQNQIQILQLKQTKYLMFALCGLALLVIIMAYLFLRQNKLKAAHFAAQLEQKLLRSQMNPHFIFNSLQAIQNFILKHEEKEAVKYLSSFATVTRNVLENSRMEAISVKKEITLLENYLQLQKLRFKERFNYEIRVDEAIDVETTKIPPMLSQPFIENAIEHGFSGIANDGKISICYTIGNNELLMEIIDNGIGIKDSHLENKQHQSLALAITKERIALMNKKAKRKIIFSIGAAFPLQKERKGVKVSFCFPLNWQV